MKLFRKFASASSQSFSQKGRCGLQHCRVQVGCLTDSQQVDIDGVQKVHLRIFADARLVSSLLAGCQKQGGKKEERKEGKPQCQHWALGQQIHTLLHHPELFRIYVYMDGYIDIDTECVHIYTRLKTTFYVERRYLFGGGVMCMTRVRGAAAAVRSRIGGGVRARQSEFARRSFIVCVDQTSVKRET